MAVMDIGLAIAAWNTILETVSFDHPEYDLIEIKRTYFTTPPESEQLHTGDMPLAISDFTLVRVDTYSQYQVQVYDIHTQVLVHDAEWDVATDIATRLLKPIIDALMADITLNNTVTRSEIRGGTPTLVAVDWAKRKVPGLDLFLQVFMNEGAVIA